ncbi:MAG: hypothetical protein IPK26_21775 [Planctomycetes bacterium]|nr:hypothetical protein [Planctomycetota bacterium]
MPESEGATRLEVERAVEEFLRVGGPRGVAWMGLEVVVTRWNGLSERDAERARPAFEATYSACRSIMERNWSLLEAARAGHFESERAELNALIEMIAACRGTVTEILELTDARFRATFVVPDIEISEFKDKKLGATLRSSGKRIFVPISRSWLRRALGPS